MGNLENMIEVYKARGKAYSTYQKCLCSAGSRGGKCPSEFKGFELWDIMWQEAQQRHIPMEDYKSIIDTKTLLANQRKLVKVEGLIECLSQQPTSPAPSQPVMATPVEPAPPVKPAVLPKVALQKMAIPHGIGVYWDVAFDDTIAQETQEMWNVTENEGIETQTVLCMSADKVSVLKEGGNSKFIKGKEEQVRAFARELKCPPDSIKIGTLHTHPPKAQEKLIKDISAVEVELTHEQSEADLNILIESDEIMTCTRSKQSITCFVNTNPVNSRLLFKDVQKEGKVAIEKQLLKGLLIDKGIRKFKKPFVGITTDGNVVCLDDGKKTECYESKLDTTNESEKLVERVETELKSARDQGKTILSTKAGANGIHLTGVESWVSKILKQDGDKRVIMVKPYSMKHIFCSEGMDGKIWCDELRGLNEIKVHKDLLIPRFERAIWDAMYERLDQDFTTTVMWTLMTTYINMLGISSEEADVKRRLQIRGIMNDYETRKDNNYFVRQLLPLIRLE